MEDMKKYENMTVQEKWSILATVANLYYNSEMTQNEIADRMYTSRSKISRMLKEKDPETVTVFIGPCMAKKSEAADKSIENNADYVLTFGEAIEMMRGKEVELEPAEETKQEGSVFGKRFGNGGGVTNAVIQCLKEQGQSTDIKVAKC